MMAMLCAGSTASANVLANPSFELPVLTGGDVPGAQGWSAFNAAFTIRVAPQQGDQALKIFGTPSGVFQDFPTSPGEQWIGSVYGLNFNGDPLSGAQIGAANIEWRDAANNVISFESTQIVSSATPQGSLPGDYVFGSVTGAAPAGATTARFVLITGAFAGAGGGAVWFDNASFALVPEPAMMSLIVPAAILMRRKR
jgi:hypothetical protein